MSEKRSIYAVVLRRPGQTHWELLNVIDDGAWGNNEYRKTQALRKAAGWQGGYFNDCEVRVIDDTDITLDKCSPQYYPRDGFVNARFVS